MPLHTISICLLWIPACAGMTDVYSDIRLIFKLSIILVFDAIK